jgi:N-acetylglucosaminyldiphosphoundecaprenol N-acetyl-beta-D-mannosaminyltransferase
VNVLGCPVDRLRMDETVERCRELIEQDGVARQVSVNAAKLVALRDDDRLRQIIAHCDIVNADGQSVVWASRMLGDPLPERVAGIDLMERLLLLAERHAYRVFFLGATPRVLERAVTKIRARHPQLRVAGYHDGYFRADDEDAVRAEISAATPDILFVAMSSPGKEYWLDSADGLDARLVMGVGGALDVLAGDVRRAPGWIQRLGLEWLYRLAQEPGRLWRRYLTTNARFLLLLAREEIGRARGIARMQ